jgi:hypothetical protein
VAERLGVALLDRAIPASVAARAGVTVETVEAVEERQQSRIDRLMSTLAMVANAATAPREAVERVDFQERRLRAEIEKLLVRASRSGRVVLGRGGAVVLRNVAGALVLAERAGVRALTRASERLHQVALVPFRQRRLNHRGSLGT